MERVFKFNCFMLATVLTLRAFLLAMSILAPKVGFQPSSRVLVTAAHLGELSGYTSVYSNPETDVGVYIKDDYKASAPPISGEVTYLDTKGYIREVFDGEFTMEPLDAETIIPGVSGTPVYYHDKPIGFISGWNGHGKVRCIFY